MFSSLFLEYVCSTEDTKCSHQRHVHLVIISGLWRRDTRREEDKANRETGEGCKDEETEEEKKKSWRGMMTTKKEERKEEK